MLNSILSYNVMAGDIIVAIVPREFLAIAALLFPAAVGYRIVRSTS